MNNTDIYKAAKIYVDRYNSDAIAEAMKMQLQLSGKGDLEGAQKWHEIIDAIVVLQDIESIEIIH